METGSDMNGIFAQQAMLADGWYNRVAIVFSEDGQIESVTPEGNPNGLERVAGPVIPGLPNVHSHAFQRALAGRGQHRSASGDSFWTWRKAMYELALGLTGDQVEAIAQFVFMEMLKFGYTSVGEFHYLHNQPDGSAYPDAAELSHRIISASNQTGLRLTLLPVLYRRGGFLEASTNPNQRRFNLDFTAWRKLVESLFSRSADTPLVQIGFAAHSLRAVSETDLHELLSLRASLAPEAPIHIHVAEQEQEVMDCIGATGQRPVEWLLNHAPVDENWCLIHSTHVTETELSRIARTRAVVGLCPTTEADLGDGFFPLQRFVSLNGRFAIGSDSHTRVSASEELRLLEYESRLATQKRNVLQSGFASTGDSLYRQALAGGIKALGIPNQGLAEGSPADLIVLDADHPLFSGRESTEILDTYLFGIGSRAVRDVFVAGKKVVEQGKHHREEEITHAMKAAFL